MTPHIAHLIAQAEQWRSEHIRAGRGIEAAACDVRLSGLHDAAVTNVGRLIAKAQRLRDEKVAAKQWAEAAAYTTRLQALYDAASVPRPKPRDQGRAA